MTTAYTTAVGSRYYAPVTTDRPSGRFRPTRHLAERVLRVTAATVGVFLLGAWASELLWALVAGSLVLALGDPA
jgi:hypothetical protein